MFKAKCIVIFTIVFNYFTDVMGADCKAIFLTDEINTQASSQLHFPKELKLRESDLELALSSANNGRIVRQIGRLFFMFESRPELYKELGYLASTRFQSEISPELNLLFRSLWRNFFLKEPDEDASYLRTREFFARATESLDHLGLTHEEIFFISYIMSPQVKLESPMLDNLLQVLKAMSEIAQKPEDNSREALLHKALFAYMDVVSKRGLNLISVDKGFEEVLIYLATKTELLYDEAQRLSMLHFESQKKSKSRDQVRKVRIHNITNLSREVFLNLAHFARENQNSSLRKLVTQAYEFLELDIIDNSWGKIEIPDEFQHTLDHLFFEATLVSSSEQVRLLMLDEVKKLLLPVKGEISNFKAKAYADSQEARVNSQKSIFATVEVSSHFGLKPESTPNPLKRKNQKHKGSNEEGDVDSLSKEADVKETVGSDRLEYWIKNPDQEITANKTYSFRFIRNMGFSEQKIVFSDKAAKKLNLKPEERAKFIRAINLGYTARSSVATPGIKELVFKKTKSFDVLFEVKAGRSIYRLLMTRVNEQWVVIDMLTKQEIERYAE